MSNVVSLVVFLGLVSLAAVTGSQFMPGPWYETLAKPWWTPPKWLFPIAWTTLYVMIAVAGWRVWKAEGVGAALIVWALGLVLNAAWSWIMFGHKEIGWALADLVAMWVTVAAFNVLALPVDRTAAYLFVPYLAWVSYAGALNFVIWRLNG